MGRYLRVSALIFTSWFKKEFKTIQEAKDWLKENFEPITKLYPIFQEQ